MHELLQTLIDSLVAITSLFLLARLMGKKQISQLSFFDYVVGISIGSIAAAFACDKTIGYIHGLISMVVFGLFPVLLSAISAKSYRAGKLLDGEPVILIQNGIIIEENLKKTKLTVNDLLEECRLKNAFHIQDIDYAVFETSGKLSVLMKAALLPLTPQDMKLQVAGRGICTNVIVDGKLLEYNLAALGVDKAWLDGELSRLNILDKAELLLCCMDSSMQVYVFRKTNNIKIASIV